MGEVVYRPVFETIETDVGGVLRSAQQVCFVTEFRSSVPIKQAVSDALHNPGTFLLPMKDFTSTFCDSPAIERGVVPPAYQQAVLLAKAMAGQPFPKSILVSLEPQEYKQILTGLAEAHETL